NLGVEITPPKKSAAGIPAIIASMKHAISEMGVKRTAKTLLTLNQKGGYDCSSCAWPDPDGDRNTAEFCESGAKAIADEATLSRATPEFFAQHSVVDLSQKKFRCCAGQSCNTGIFCTAQRCRSFAEIGLLARAEN